MLQWLDDKLRSDVEGKCVGQYGYIITVLNIIDTGSGTVIPGDGAAEFLCRYRAIVFKPFKGEVLEGVVDEISKVSSVPIALTSAYDYICALRWASLLKSDRCESSFLRMCVLHTNPERTSF